MSNKTVIGGWSAAANGFEPGKQVEYEVLELKSKQGGTFNLFKMFKPFRTTDRIPDSPTFGQEIWAQGTTFSPNQHAEIIDRINHMIASGFSDQKGAYVFQPAQQVMQQPVAAQQYVQPPAQPYGQAPQQYAQQVPQQGYAQPGQPPHAVQPQPGQAPVAPTADPSVAGHYVPAPGTAPQG